MAGVKQVLPAVSVTRAVHPDLHLRLSDNLPVSHLILSLTQTPSDDRKNAAVSWLENMGVACRDIGRQRMWIPKHRYNYWTTAAPY